MKKILLISIFSLLVFASGNVWAQERTVSGKVTSLEDGSGLPGVNVLLMGTTTGTITDVDGNFSVKVPEEGGKLRFTFIGLATEEVEIGTRSVIDIQMSPDIKQLSEIVVQAYGNQSERLNVQQVETVGAAQFEDFPVLSPQEALQGQAGGVQVTGSSGVLGTAQTIRIRGVASLNAGTSPLYVIDGVPLNDASGGTEGYSDAAGGSALNPLFDLNPNDIETMTVLKDASAVALYGSRGANGVILITTKKGSQSQKTQFSADYFTGWGTATVEKDVMSADQWRSFRSAYLSANGTPTTPDGLPQTSYDWLDAVSKTARTNSYSLSARGGTEKTSFYVGGTFYETDSYVIGNDVEKLNGRFNLNHKASDKVNFGFNLALSRLENDRLFQENSTSSPWTVGMLNLPVLSAYDEEGNYQLVGFDNPIAQQDLNTFLFVSRRSTGNIYLEAEPVKDLKLKTDWGIDMIQAESEFRTVDFFVAGGSATKEVIQDNKWLTTNTATYDKSFGKHSMTALAGFSFETAERNDIEVSSQNFISDALPNTISGATPTTTENSVNEWALFSTFGRLNYRYNDRYIFETSLRRDGSSRFGANNRYGTFWAVSGGWLLSDEDFFPQNDILNFAKISTSYGIAGNDRINNFASLGLYSGGRDYNGNPGLEAAQASNPDLTWESTAQLDINLNAHFLKSRIKLDVSWYQKTTTDLLLDEPLPTTTGFASRTGNAGEVRNTGIDLNITATAIDKGDFKWDINTNLGILKNEVISLPNAAEDDFGDSFVGLLGFTGQRAVVGRSLNEFYMLRYNGVNPETGDPTWLTRDGEVTNNPGSADFAYVGSALPDFTGGITNTFSYKGFELRVFFNFVSGGKVYLADNEFSNNIASSGSWNLTTDVLDYWTQPGDDAFAPSLSSPYISDFDQESTMHLFDASYVRLKNARLSYNLPRQILDKTNFLSRARVYVQGQNLLTLFSEIYDDEHTDPEVNNAGVDVSSSQGESFYTSPQARTITLGVSLGF